MVLALVGGYLGLPLWIGYAVSRALAERGLPSQVESVHVDIWNRQVTLYRLRIGPADRPAITFAETTVELVPEALLEGRLEIADLRLRGAEFDLDALSNAAGAASSGAPGWPVELKDIHIRDIRLVAASRKVGREVVVRNAVLRDIGALAAEGAGYELDVDVAAAPLKLAGRVRSIDGDAVLSGDVQASGIPAALFGPGDGERWSGKVHAALDFELRHSDRDGVVGVQVSGSLRAERLGADFARVRVEDADAIWSGDLELEWPLLAAPERVRIAGTLDASRATIRTGDDQEPTLTARARGLHWRGTVEWQSGLDIEGQISARALDLERHGDPDGLQAMRLAGLTVSGELEDSLAYRLSIARARSARLQWAADGATNALLLEDLEVQPISGRGLTFHSKRVRAAQASAFHIQAGADAVWTMTNPTLIELAGAVHGVIAAQNATIDGIRIRQDDADVRMLGAAIQDLERLADGTLRAATTSVEKFARHAEHGVTRASGLTAQSVALNRKGELEVGRAIVARVAQHTGDSVTWAADDGRLHELLWTRSGAPIEIGEAVLGSFVYQPPGGVVFQALDLSARALALQADGSGEADSVGAERLEYRERAGASWRVDAMALAAPQWQADGALAVQRALATRVSHRSGEADQWDLDTIRVEALALEPGGELRADRLIADRVALLRPDGSVLRAEGVHSHALLSPASGGPRVGDLDLQSLAYADAGGLAWRAAPLRIDSLARTAQGIRAQALEAELVEVTDADAGQWRGEGLESARFEWRAAGALLADPVRLSRIEHRSAHGDVWAASGVAASGLDWRFGSLPFARDAGVELLQGRGTLGWRVSDLHVVAHGTSGAEPRRLETVTLGAGYIEGETGARSRVTWASVHARDVSLAALRIDAADLILGQLSLAGRDQSAGAGVDVARMRLERPSWQLGRHLSVQSIDLERARVALGVDREGRWVLPRWPGDEPGERAVIRVGSLRTTADNQLTFFDDRMEPTYRLVFRPLQLAIRDLDTVDPNRKARFELRSTVAEFASLEAAGELTAGISGFDVEGHGRLSGLDLTAVSEYAVRYLDASIESGHGDLDFEVALAGGQLDGVGDLVLTRLEVGAPPAAKGDREQAHRAPSLATTLALLEDKHGTVRLRVPVSGPIADPQFDYGDAVGRAIINTAQSALGITLKPVGILLSAGRFLGLGGVRAEPVGFDPGIAQSSAEGLARLDALAEQLLEHPQMRVLLCGKASVEDVRRLAQSSSSNDADGDETLLDAVGEGRRRSALSLAKARADFAASYLIDKHAIPSSQLRECTPQVDGEPGGLPRLEVMVDVTK